MKTENLAYKRLVQKRDIYGGWTVLSEAGKRLARLVGDSLDFILKTTQPFGAQSELSEMVSESGYADRVSLVA